MQALRRELERSRDRRPAALRGARGDRRLDRAGAQPRTKHVVHIIFAGDLAGRSLERSTSRTRPFAATGCSRSELHDIVLTRRSSASSPAGSPATRRLSRRALGSVAWGEQPDSPTGPLPAWTDVSRPELRRGGATASRRLARRGGVGSTAQCRPPRERARADETPCASPSSSSSERLEPRRRLARAMGQRLLPSSQSAKPGVSRQQRPVEVGPDRHGRSRQPS